MITIGIDAHKRVHAAVAVDEAGQEVGQWGGPNTITGWCDLAAWAATLGPSRRFGVEGAWGYGRRLAQHLVGEREMVFEVNARLTALGRRHARQRSKTDSLDARAVALCVLREAPALPVVNLEDDTAVLELLSQEREAAVAEATRLRNQIHAHVMQLDPGYQRWLPPLRSRAAVAHLKAFEFDGGTAMQRERAAVVRDLADRLDLALAQAGELANRIRGLAASRFEPLTRICGINLLTAGTLAGILGPRGRFTSEAGLASYAGVAPLETSSAERVRHRLNRGGNRRLNAVLYRIVLTQAHHSPEAKVYLNRRVAEGKTRREATRALKRYVIRAIWRMWKECTQEAANLSSAPRTTFGCT